MCVPYYSVRDAGPKVDVTFSHVLKKPSGIALRHRSARKVIDPLLWGRAVRYATVTCNIMGV